MRVLLTMKEILLLKTQVAITTCILAAICLATPARVRAQQASLEKRPPNGESQKPAFAGQTRAPERKSGVAFDVVTVAEGLENPWGLTFLPGGRCSSPSAPAACGSSARRQVVRARRRPAAQCDARGQGGLLDVALDPAIRHRTA